MLRYKTETRPGLVALYDIRPGNGVGQFLQPRSLHEAALIRQRASCELIKLSLFTGLERSAQRSAHALTRFEPRNNGAPRKAASWVAMSSTDCNNGSVSDGSSRVCNQLSTIIPPSSFRSGGLV